MQTLAALWVLLQFLLVHMNFDHADLEGTVSLCPPLTLAVTAFLPHHLQCSLCSESRNLMETSLLGLSVPSSLPLWIMSGYISLYLSPLPAGGSFSDDGWRRHCLWLQQNIIRNYIIFFLFKLVLFGSTIGPWVIYPQIFYMKPNSIRYGFHLMECHVSLFTWLFPQDLYRKHCSISCRQ